MEDTEAWKNYSNEKEDFNPCIMFLLCKTAVISKNSLYLLTFIPGFKTWYIQSLKLKLLNNLESLY